MQKINSDWIFFQWPLLRNFLYAEYVLFIHIYIFYNIFRNKNDKYIFNKTFDNLKMLLIISKEEKLKMHKEKIK